MASRLLLTAVLIALYSLCYSQDSLSKLDKLASFPSHFISAVNKKAQLLETKLTKQTVKYLERLRKKEDKLRKKLQSVDSVAAKNLFNADNQYATLIAKISNTSAGSKGSSYYLPLMDSLKGSLSFLQQNNQLLSGSKELRDIVRFAG